MRQRKRADRSQSRDDCNGELASVDFPSHAQRRGQSVFVTSAAVAVAVYVGFRFAVYLKQLHENEMFFSAIQVMDAIQVIDSLLACSNQT